MLSKWEFITIFCALNGYRELAQTAFFIEKILKRMYGDTATQRWQNNYKSIVRRTNTLTDLLTIADVRAYCIACVNSSYLCENCRFGKETGYCYESDSLYYEFVEKVENIIGNL